MTGVTEGSLWFSTECSRDNCDECGERDCACECHDDEPDDDADPS